MKPLTIEELKALEVGDWVWVKDLTRSGYAAYVQKDTKSNEKFNQLSWALFYSGYGKTWLAYKNKEQAEAEGEIVELPCIRKINNKPFSLNEVVYVQMSGTISSETYSDDAQAKRRLAELKGEK